MAAPIVRPTVTIIRSCAGLVPDVVVEEQHQDQLVITGHPVESGANIADHAFKLPAEVIVTYGWAEGGTQNKAMISGFLTSIYLQILAIQSSFMLFSVFTTHRMYTNMLLQSITKTMDKEHENVMLLRLLCKQVILSDVTTITVPLDPSVHSNPPSTLPVANQGTQSLQPQSTFNSSSYLQILPPRQ